MPSAFPHFITRPIQCVGPFGTTNVFRLLMTLSTIHLSLRTHLVEPPPKGTAYLKHALCDIYSEHKHIKENINFTALIYIITPPPPFGFRYENFRDFKFFIHSLSPLNLFRVTGKFEEDSGKVLSGKAEGVFFRKY